MNGKNVPNYVQSEGNAKFRVNFKPQEAAVHTLSVRFNGEPVPGTKIYNPSDRATLSSVYPTHTHTHLNFQVRRSAVRW